MLSMRFAIMRVICIFKNIIPIRVEIRLCRHFLKEMCATSTCFM